MDHAPVDFFYIRTAIEHWFASAPDTHICKDI